MIINYNFLYGKETESLTRNAGFSGLFSGLAVILTILFLSAAGCATWGNGRHASPEPVSMTPSDLTSRFEKQQIIIDDLSERITELENILLRQEYDIKKLKKIVKKHNTQSISLACSASEIEGDEEEQEDELSHDSSSYSIYMDVSGANDEKDDDSNRPLLKIHGGPSKASYAFSSEKALNVASLMKEAAVAATFIPLKLDTMPLVPDSGPAGPSAEDHGAGGEKEIKLESVDPYDAAVIRYKSGKWMDAALYFDIFLKKNPESIKTANALFLKGESLFQAGKTLKALGSFELVESKFPEFSRVPDAKFRIGRCYEKLNDKDKARKVYEGIIQNYPKSAVALKALNRLKKIKKKGS